MALKKYKERRLFDLEWLFSHHHQLQYSKNPKQRTHKHTSYPSTKMQSKALILLLTGLVAAVSGAAAPANEVEIIEESTGPLNARQADITWQATGGCKTDWYVLLSVEWCIRQIQNANHITGPTVAMLPAAVRLRSDLTPAPASSPASGVKVASLAGACAIAPVSARGQALSDVQLGLGGSGGSVQ